MQYFEYNGETSLSKGIILTDYIQMPTGIQKTTIYDIPGADGSLHDNSGFYDEIEFEFGVMFREDVTLHANERYRLLKRWLRGTGELRLDDDPGWHWNVKNIGVSEKTVLSHRIREFAQFTVTFTCDPYAYLDDGTKEYSIEECLWNPYDICHPTFHITGSGECTIMVNGGVMRATIYGELTVDTDKMVAYRDGLYAIADADGMMIADNDDMAIQISDDVIRTINYTVGDYENLWLAEGKNEISCTESFDVTIVPNWRAL